MPIHGDSSIFIPRQGKYSKARASITLSIGTVLSFHSPQKPNMITIVEATTIIQLDAVRALICAFVAWQQVTYHDHLDLLNKYFDSVAFEEELSGLPGKYAPPQGRLLLALNGERPVGCVALRPVGDQVGEMKRMFVLPDYHGKGVGRALAKRLIDEARVIGYKHMRLDTGPRQLAAQDLYRSLGFKDIAPYYEVPEDMRIFLLFMELAL